MNIVLKTKKTTTVCGQRWQELQIVSPIYLLLAVFLDTPRFEEVYSEIKRVRDSIVIPEIPDYTSELKTLNVKIANIFNAIEKLNEFGDRITIIERLDLGAAVKDLRKMLEKMDKREADEFKKVWDILKDLDNKSKSSSSSSEDLVDKKDLEKLEKKVKALEGTHKTHGTRIVGLEDLITELRRLMPTAAEPTMNMDELTERFRKISVALEEKLNRADYTPSRQQATVEVKTDTTAYADKKLTKKTFEMILRKLRSLEEQMNACGGKAAPEEHVEMDLQPV